MSDQGEQQRRHVKTRKVRSAADRADPIAVSDPPFIHRYPGTARAHRVVDPVVNAVNGYGPRKRARKWQAYATLLGTVGIVVANLVHWPAPGLDDTRLS